MHTYVVITAMSDGMLESDTLVLAQPTSCFCTWLVGWLVGWMVSWLVGWWVSRWVNGLVGWFVGCLSCRVGLVRAGGEPGLRLEDWGGEHWVHGDRHL